MKCKNCGNETITVLCYFQQNVSVFIARNVVTYSGYYCDKCINKIFLSATTKTLFGTWWGIMGAFLGPGIIFNNFKEFIKARFAIRIEKQKILRS